MLTYRKIGYATANGHMKEEPLDVLRTAKPESDSPTSLDDYREVSSTIENIPTNTSLEIKVEAEETDTKLALATSIDTGTDDFHELKANENRPELNSYIKKTPPENQGFDCTTNPSKTTGSQRKWKHYYSSNARNEHQTTTDKHKAMPTFMSKAVNYMSSNLDRYCEPCDAIFTTRYSYRLHIRKPHSTPVILSSSYKSRSRRIPDINDSNSHCNVCECRFRTRSIYRTHLHSIHQIGASRECEVPPTFKCPICKRRYKSKRSCDDHVKTKHNTISLL
ncbi:hypothetical protein V8B55DRAFT_1364399 [Mucor lusitanicus]|uniref:C2H2-type domain-containing protein n=1 Tax=Mucor circinelloides f. lusitanicus TaxID=29924 RepID=A0A8H4F1E0_MUCCL|nr:hypothetical protein FB192DRAFT_1437548 [Mucor lusitanicus]